MDMKDSILILRRNATVSNRYELEQRRTIKMLLHAIATVIQIPEQLLQEK
jgi:hypothetical protein